jgi:C_GCAxxG_C_C family probable redox protein
MKEQEALEYFRGGFNCAQAVFTVFAKEKNVDEATALKIACGFGGGMGRLQATCGAVTGAYMAIGLNHGKSLDDEGNEKREKTYSLVKTFDAEFKNIFSVVTCRELMQCDLNTEAGKKYAAEHNLVEKVCERCVTEAVKIVEKIL